MSKTINKLEKESIPNFDVPKPIVIFSAYFLGNASKRLSTEITTLASRYEGNSKSSGIFLWKVTRKISMSEVDTGLTLNLS